MVEATAQQDTLIASILSLSKFTDDEDSLAIATTGMQSLFERVFDQVDNFADIRVDKRFVEDLIDELDEKLSRQMDEILHNEEFKALEAPWRSLKFLTSRTNFAENIKISMLSVRQDELLDDFADAADITECGLYRKVYTDEYGQFGGEPFGVMIGNYALSPSAADVALMTHMSALSAMTHAPFIAGTHQRFFWN